MVCSSTTCVRPKALSPKRRSPIIISAMEVVEPFMIVLRYRRATRSAGPRSPSTQRSIMFSAPRYEPIQR